MSEVDAFVARKRLWWINVIFHCLALIWQTYVERRLARRPDATGIRDELT